MKRILSSLSRRSSPNRENNRASTGSPEDTILREVKAFCEPMDGPNHENGTAFVHLPAIVESAESSPEAAKLAARRLQKYLTLGRSRPGYMQYNAVMLLRILIDNPGHTFSRNLDAKFVDTVQNNLRMGKNQNVRQILAETLDGLEANRSGDADLKPLIEMWKNEKAKFAKRDGNPRNDNMPYTLPPQQHTGLPPADELAARISEAQTSAKLLIQLVQSTPVAELQGNELTREFCDRCRAAVRSVQGYIDATDPPPDEDTLFTLIQTNDELSVALSKYQHAVLKARKADTTTPAGNVVYGPSSSSSSSQPLVSGAVAVPTIAPPQPRIRSQVQVQDSSLSPESPSEPVSEMSFPPALEAGPSGTEPTGPRYEYNSDEFQVQNPFADSYATGLAESKTASVKAV
ncbi:hypothetical protein ASPZODRAFT_133507 [Penicilliopsis zonata CBS 506.65]|uniref:GAT domain-containing protein n=1 Tax=Penicilliopsis zonata CBS 506.65 TaxID=1073090 RepID=A0A1L9SEL5_9EURO|nr:hypothetical protein ASPZODRAFT_133507 [Penicilliopsis zonata CBS 506.65]OJJ45646.1 hypothetical protein ASPZODRAFT_133507 [Penicilliopsis zonata CBS 506.65]